VQHRHRSGLFLGAPMIEGHDETRWYRVQMDSGPFSTGANEYDLVRDVRDCIRRGVDFTVTWHDTSDLAMSTKPKIIGHVTLDEDERCTGWSD